MIVLRWYVIAGIPQLQYRQILWRPDAAGAVSVVPIEWGPWQDVPTENADEASRS